MTRRRFGQHFLVDQSVIHNIMESAGITKGHVVLEIGTGYGTLTIELAKVAQKVISYEIDRRLWSQARTNLSHIHNVKLINSNFRDSDEEFDILVTSLPFSESAGFMTWLIQRHFTLALAVLQKEFVEKLIAPTSSRLYRSVTVLAQMRFDVEKLGAVPPSSFRPPPKVWAEIVRFTPKARFLSSSHVRLVKSIFAFRGRTLGAFLRHWHLTQAPINRDVVGRRIEELTPVQYREVISALEQTPSDRHA